MNSIERLCDGFEACHQRGERPDLTEWANRAPVEKRGVVLVELIAVEVYYRRRAGEQPTAGEYLQRFPDLDAAAIAAEFSRPVADLPTVETSTPQPTDQRGRLDAEGSVFGPYTLERVLGEGGMGSVWVAKQRHPVKRRVALKLIKTGMNSREVVLRFEQERQALAVMDHPNIARVLDAGLTPDGRPFFAMELVNGLPLAAFCDEAKLKTRDRLDIFLQICAAVQHAHQKGVIHRDLKPGNILVTLIDGRPVPKVIDFGVAKALAGKLTDETMTTQFGAVIGTLEYMAPEQAGYSGTDIDTRADIYALGVILYELLTGLRPFDSQRFRQAALHEIVRIIQEEDPIKPSTRVSTSEALPSLAAARQVDPKQLSRSLRGDLDWIALKCLEKDRSNRYETAGQLALDINRYLADQPVEAGPPGGGYLLRKFIKRHRLKVLTGVAVLFALLVGLAASLWQMNRAIAAEQKAVAAQREEINQRKRAEEQTRFAEGQQALAAQSAREAKAASQIAVQRSNEARYELARSHLSEARTLRGSLRLGPPDMALNKVIAAREIFRELENKGISVAAADWKELRNEAANSLLVRGFEMAAAWPRESELLAEVATDIAHNRYVVMQSNAPQAQICRIGTGEHLGSISAPAGCSFGYGTFSENGNRLVLHSVPDHQIHFWEMSGEPRHIRSLPTPVHWRGLSPDGSLYAAGHSDPLLRIIRVDDGQVIAESNLGLPLFVHPFHPHKPWVALQSGRNLIAFDYKQQKTVWQRSFSSDITAGSWSSDGQWILLTGIHEVQAFAANSGAPNYPKITEFDADGVFAMPVSQAGMIATTDWSGSLRFFDLHTGRLRLKTSAKFFSWPRAIGAAGQLTLGYSAKNYVVIQPQLSRLREFAPHASSVNTISHSGRLIATNRIGFGVGIHSLPGGQLLAEVPAAWGHIPLAFEKDDHGLLTYGNGKLQRLPFVWRDNSHTHLRVGPPETLVANDKLDSWGVDRNGETVAAINFDAGATIYRLSHSTRELITLHTEPQQDVRQASVSPDGKWVVLGSHVNGKIAVYSSADGKLVRNLIVGGGWSRFSPDGRWLAVGRFAGEGELFQVEGWKSCGHLPGNSGAFTNDGKLLAVDSGPSTIVLLETESLREVARLQIQDQTIVYPFAFTADGCGLIASTPEQRRLFFFDLAGLRKSLQKLDLDWDYPPFPPLAAEIDSIPTVEIVEPTAEPLKTATPAEK